MVRLILRLLLLRPIEDQSLLEFIEPDMRLLPFVLKSCEHARQFLFVILIVSLHVHHLVLSHLAHPLLLLRSNGSMQLLKFDQLLVRVLWRVLLGRLSTRR